MLLIDTIIFVVCAGIFAVLFLCEVRCYLNFRNQNSSGRFLYSIGIFCFAMFCINLYYAIVTSIQFVKGLNNG